MTEIDAGVENFFSKYDDEELVDQSAPSADTPDESSKEEPEVAPKDESKEDESKPSNGEAEDKDTPFHEHPRWKEVMKERKELRESQKAWKKEKSEMSERLSRLENIPKTDDEISNMTPQEAMEYAREQMKQELESKSTLSKREDKEADEYIEETLSDIRDAGHDFDENKLLKYADEYTNGDIEKAFDLYQKLETTKAEGASQEAKEAAKKKAAQSNNSNRGGGSKATGFVRGTGWGDLQLK